MALDAAEFQAKYGVAKPSLDAPELVFHCQMGRRGQLATDKAIALGFQRYRPATCRLPTFGVNQTVLFSKK